MESVSWLQLLMIFRENLQQHWPSRYWNWGQGQCSTSMIDNFNCLNRAWWSSTKKRCTTQNVSMCLLTRLGQEIKEERLEALLQEHGKRGKEFAHAVQDISSRMPCCNIPVLHWSAISSRPWFVGYFKMRWPKSMKIFWHFNLFLLLIYWRVLDSVWVWYYKKKTGMHVEENHCQKGLTEKERERGRRGHRTWRITSGMRRSTDIDRA